MTKEVREKCDIIDADSVTTALYLLTFMDLNCVRLISCHGEDK